MTLTKALGGGGGGSGTVTTVKDEGTNLSTAVTSIDFVGAGVTATGTTAVTVTIPGGGTGRFWDVTAIPTDASVQTSRTLDFADGAASIAGFTWGNQGSATAAIQRKRLYMAAPSNGASSNSRRVLYPTSTYQIPGSTPWCVQVPVTVYGHLPFGLAGIYLKNTVNSKAYSFSTLLRNDAGTGYGIFITTMNSETAGVSNVFTSPGTPQCILAIGYDGTTFKFWVSPDGQDWKPTAHYSIAATTHIGSGGTYQFGFMVDSTDAVQSAGAFNNSVILNQATPVPHGQFV